MSPPAHFPASCPHLSSYRSSVSRPFRHLRRCLRVRPLGLPSVRLDPLSHPHCPFCPSSSLLPSSPRLLACLSCAAVFCPSHAASHPISSPGHHISVDLLRAELFCCSCSDQIYDHEFDSAVVLAQSPFFPASISSNSGFLPRSKRRRVDFKQWSPDPSQSQLILARSTPLDADPTTSGSGSDSGPSPGLGLHPWGLRGLNNMGNTCFMNCVLQALLHAPPLRNYFLSDRHNRFLCARKSRKKRGGSGEKSGNGDLCLVCDLDQIYSAVFSGDRAPFSPANFLYR